MSSISNEGEIFDIFDDNEKIIGKATRGETHRLGLYHRSVNVAVIQAHKILLQRRSAQKKIYPSAWDISTAEHLVSGESYREAALRGLREELSLDVSPLTDRLVNLRPSQLFKYDDENLGIKDYEYTQLWLLHYDAKEDGQIVQDGIEVMDTQWVDLENIFRKADMRHANIYKTQDVSRYGDSADHSDSKKEKVTYTSWFLNEICYIQQYFSVANNA